MYFSLCYRTCSGERKRDWCLRKIKEVTKLNKILVSLDILRKDRFKSVLERRSEEENIERGRVAGRPGVWPAFGT